MQWYMVRSKDPDAEPIQVRESYDYSNLSTMPPPPVGARIEYAIDGNIFQTCTVKKLIWDVTRGIVRVLVQ